MKALVILSGGQDSTTCLALAVQRYGLDNVHAITFDYGQRHAVEVTAARRIAHRAGIAQHDGVAPLKSGRHEIVPVPSVLQGTSPLVNPQHKVEQYSSAGALPGGLEKTFVPMRNALFLVLAANRAVVLALEDDTLDSAQRNVLLITGVSQEDYGGYPDCRAPFLIFMESMVAAALDAPEMPKVKIDAPLLYLDKKATVNMAVELDKQGSNVKSLLALSHTCYNGAVPPCGHCHACLLRAKGFQLAGVADPLIQELIKDGQLPGPLAQ